MAVPLLVRDQPIGWLLLGHSQPQAYTARDASLAQTVANQAAVAIENARLYEQARRLAVLEERQRLARELHDSVSQALYGIGLGARTARALLDRDPAQAAEPLEYILSLADGGLAEMRALIFELRPDSLEREGLVAALSRQAAALQSRHKIDVQTEFCAEPSLPFPIKEALYRIAQEAVNNAVRHAQASQVLIRLDDCQGQLLLEIQDNGSGFDPGREHPGHLGLQSMAERAARIGGMLEVLSQPGQGTRVQMRLPHSGSD
jgi:signal transduction histidine kinase